MGVGPTRSEATVEPFGGPAFEPLISSGGLGARFLRGEGSLSGYPPFPVPVARDRERGKRKRIRNRTTWRTFSDAVITAKVKRRGEGNENGDNFVDFGILETNRETEDGGYEKAILMEFNVDGPILDLI